MNLDYNFSKADKLKKSGKFEDAFLIYENILAKFPKNNRALNGKNLCIKFAPKHKINFVRDLFQRNYFLEAKYEVNKLILKYPKDEILYNIAGAIFTKCNDFDRAIQHYKKAIELKPSFSEVLNNLGELYNQIGDFDLAKEYCMRAVKTNSNYAEAYNNLGNALLQLGLFGSAKTNFEISIKLNNPDKYKVFNNLGLVYANIGDFNKSTEFLIKSLQEEPKNSKAVNSLSYCLIYISDFKYNQETEDFLSERYNDFDFQNQIFILHHSHVNSFIKGDNQKCLHIGQKLELEFERFQQSEHELSSKDLLFIKSYKNYIFKLRSILEKKSPPKRLSNEKLIYHIGDSHCLSFAHYRISINKQEYLIKPMLIYGLKAWHLSSNNHYNQKLLISRLKQIPDNSEVFISLGEIDTRFNEGIITFHKKSSESLDSIIKNTVTGYVDFIENYLKGKNITKYYFSISAPWIEKNKLAYDKKLLDLRIYTIKTFNENLSIHLKKYNSKYLDTFSFTKDKDNFSNKKFMLDSIHLSPNSIKMVEKLINNK